MLVAGRWMLHGLMRGFINHLGLPGGIGKAGSKAAFHWVSWWTNV